MEWGYLHFRAVWTVNCFSSLWPFCQQRIGLHQLCVCNVLIYFLTYSFNDYSISKLFIALFTPNLNIHDKYHGLVTNAPSYRQERILHFNL